MGIAVYWGEAELCQKGIVVAAATISSSLAFVAGNSQQKENRGGMVRVVLCCIVTGRLIPVPSARTRKCLDQFIWRHYESTPRLHVRDLLTHYSWHSEKISMCGATLILPQHHSYWSQAI